MSNSSRMSNDTLCNWDIFLHWTNTLSMTQQQRHSPTASALMTQNRSQCQRCSLVTLLWSAGCDQCGSFPCSLSELMSHSVARSHNLSPVPPASRSGPWTAFLVHLAAASTWCLCSDIDIYWSLFFFPGESVKTISSGITWFHPLARVDTTLLSQMTLGPTLAPEGSDFTEQMCLKKENMNFYSWNHQPSPNPKKNWSFS